MERVPPLTGEGFARSCCTHDQSCQPGARASSYTRIGPAGAGTVDATVTVTDCEVTRSRNSTRNVYVVVTAGRTNSGTPLLTLPIPGLRVPVPAVKLGISRAVPPRAIVDGVAVSESDGAVREALP